ncbi:MAG: biopolymer transporter ExbD [Methylacidiphilales bacterium]|nr:biopolymer transporter ExbD [Candidatus Methylacidiphilales bacterium]NJR16305.1 biopolymer transporter ExbD [Calothrix sp. CSU_2_0]
MRLPDEPDIPAQINIVPMIDVIFAILTFFIMSTLFLTRTGGLPVNLPKAETAQQQRPESAPIAVTIEKSGQVSLNGNGVDLEALIEQVTTLTGNSQNDFLVEISADESVSHGRVVAVMDKLRQIPGARLAIATATP